MLANKLMFSQTVDQVNVQERVARLFSRSIKKESKVTALNNILSMIDLTTLEGKDSPGKVRQLSADPGTDCAGALPYSKAAAPFLGNLFPLGWSSQSYSECYLMQ
jgi:hypothetical protein